MREVSDDQGLAGGLCSGELCCFPVLSCHQPLPCPNSAGDPPSTSQAASPEPALLN